MSASSASSQGLHAETSEARGFLCSRRFPRSSNLKCFTALVTYTSERSIPASTRARLSSFPAGPTNGCPRRSSSLPGCSPINMIDARLGPSPKTACVAWRYRSHPRHCWTAWRSSGSVAFSGTYSAADFKALAGMISQFSGNSIAKSVVPGLAAPAGRLRPLLFLKSARLRFRRRPASPLTTMVRISCCFIALPLLVDAGDAGYNTCAEDNA